jgi:glucokinase
VAERFVEALEAGEESPIKERVERGETLTSADIADAARSGDALAARIWDETCLYLAVACVNIQHVLNPECVVLAGGLIKAGDQLLEPVRAHFRRLAWQIAQDHPRIEFATLGDDAGIIGAAALARREFSGGNE